MYRKNERTTIYDKSSTCVESEVYKRKYIYIYKYIYRERDNTRKHENAGEGRRTHLHARTRALPLTSRCDLEQTDPLFSIIAAAHYVTTVRWSRHV